MCFRGKSVEAFMRPPFVFANTRRIVYKGWLTRDEIWRLVDLEKIIRDGVK